MSDEHPDLFDAEGERWHWARSYTGLEGYMFEDGPHLWKREDIEEKFGPMKADKDLTPKDRAVFRLYKALHTQLSDEVTVSYEDLHLILRNVR